MALAHFLFFSMAARMLESVLLEKRWRLHSIRNFHSLWLVLCDSQTTLAVVSKRRSSSVRFSRILKKLNALTLVSNSHQTLIYVRSTLNPADRPSRNLPPVISKLRPPGRRRSALRRKP